MRLSRMWRIMQIEGDVIHQGWRPRWITLSEISIILHIIRKPNSTIICILFIQNIFKFLINLPAGRLSSKLWPSAQFQNNYKHRYFFADTPQKVDSIYWAICFAYSCFPSTQFQSEIQLHVFRFWIATWTTFSLAHSRINS